jgi:hypothetical protein
MQSCEVGPLGRVLRRRPAGKEKPASSGSERAGFAPRPFVGKGRREIGGPTMPTQWPVRTGPCEVLRPGE